MRNDVLWGITLQSPSNLLIFQVFSALVSIGALCQCAHGGGRIIQVSVQRLIVRQESRIKRVNFLKQQQQLVRLAGALLIVLGLLLITQNILFHCHGDIQYNIPSKISGLTEYRKRQIALGAPYSNTLKHVDLRHKQWYHAIGTVGVVRNPSQHCKALYCFMNPKCSHS